MTTADDVHRHWKDLPIGRLDDVVGRGTALVLAPHPDDESLGCGGLIAACVADGRPPLIVVLTDGAASHPRSRSYPPDRLRAVRMREIQIAVGRLGLTSDRIVFLNQPDAAVPNTGPDFDAIIIRLAGLIRQEPDCTAILAPWRHDPHCDHEAASLAAGAAATIVGVRNVAFPVWGWMLPPTSVIEEAPAKGWRLDISPFIPAKRAAIQAHQSQYGDLITDDPDGFRLPSGLLSIIDSPYETYLQS